MPAVHRHALLASVLFLSAIAAHAADDEIQVYEDEIDEPGEFGLEMHMNYVVASHAAPATPAQTPPLHVFRFTPEFSYGVSERFDVGLYLPMVRTPEEDPELLGAKLRAKYLDVNAGQPWYWGMNFELGRVSRTLDDAHWGLEVRPIIGYRAGRLTVTVNPILEWALSGSPADASPEFAPCAKVSWRVLGDWRVGVEHYAGMGPLDEPLPARERAQNTFLAVDGKRGSTDFNVGIGRGWSGESDTWVVKAVVGLEF